MATEDRYAGDDPEGSDYDMEEEDDPNLVLQRDRQANDERLKDRFEHIFQKYGQDFEDVGDEIDMETGEVVVDRGHLSGMRHEVDPGQAPASRLMLDFAASLEEEDKRGDSSAGDEESTDDSESRNGGDSNNAGTAIDPRLRRDGPSFGPSPSRSNAQFDHQPTASMSSGKRPRLSPSLFIAAQNDTQSSAEDDSSETNAQPTLLQQLPSLQQSMQALQAGSRRGDPVDPDAINALGQSIAKQIADFMSGNATDKTEKGKKRSKDPLWDFPELPKTKKPKRTSARTSSRPSTTRSMRDKAFPTSPGDGESIWAAPEHPKFIRPRQKFAEARAQASHFTPAAHDSQTAVLQNNEEYVPLREHLEAAVAATGRKGCSHCGITVSPSWRSGPNGASDLCNACGMYWYRYGLLKPLDRMRFHQETPEHDRKDEAADEPLETAFGRNAANIGRRVSTSVGNARHTRFTLDEDMLLIKFKEIDDMSWEALSKHFVGRTSYACQGRYSKKLFDRPSEARDALIEQGYVFPDCKGGASLANADAEFYSQEEDDMLVQLREEHNLDWNELAAMLPERDSSSVEQRYYHLKAVARGEVPRKPPATPFKHKRKHSTSQLDRCNGSASHSRYTVQDDMLIKKLREEDGLSWEAIERKVPGRTALSMQKRYKRDIEGKTLSTLQSLSSAQALSGEEHAIMLAMRASLPEKAMAPGAPKSSRRYTQAEDGAIIWMREKRKATWAQVAESMYGRTFDGVRNRYQVLRPDSAKPKQADRALRASTCAPEDVATPTVSVTPAGGNARIAAAESTPQTVTKAGGLYSEEEDSMIVELKEDRHLTWETMTRYLPARSAGALQQRYAAIRDKQGKEGHMTILAEARKQMTGVQALHPSLWSLQGPDNEAAATRLDYATHSRPEEANRSSVAEQDSPSDARHVDTFATPARAASQAHPYFAPPLPAPTFTPASRGPGVDNLATDKQGEDVAEAAESDGQAVQVPRGMLPIPGKPKRPRGSSSEQQVPVHNTIVDPFLSTNQGGSTGAEPTEPVWRDLITSALESVEDQTMTVAQIVHWMRNSLESFREEYGNYAKVLSLQSTLRDHLRHQASFANVEDSFPVKWTFFRNLSATGRTASQDLTHTTEAYDDFCSACNGGGEVVCCDGCKRCYHAHCHAPPISDAVLQSDDSWYCHICIEGQRLATEDPTLAESPEACSSRVPSAGCYDPDPPPANELIGASASQHSPAPKTAPSNPSLAQLTSDTYRDPETSSPQVDHANMGQMEPGLAIRDATANSANAASSSPFFYDKHGSKPCTSCTSAGVRCDGRKPCTPCFQSSTHCSLAPRTYAGRATSSVKRPLVQYRSNTKMTPSKATLRLLESYSKPAASPKPIVAHDQGANHATAGVVEAEAAEASASPVSVTPGSHPPGQETLPPACFTVQETVTAPKTTNAQESTPATPRLKQVPSASDLRQKDTFATLESPEIALLNESVAIAIAASATEPSQPGETDIQGNAADVEDVARSWRGNAPMVPRMVATMPEDQEDPPHAPAVAIGSDRVPSSSKGSTPDEIPAKATASKQDGDKPPSAKPDTPPRKSRAPYQAKDVLNPAKTPTTEPVAAARASRKAKGPGRSKSSLNTRQAPIPRHYRNFRTVRNGKKVGNSPVVDHEGSEDELA